MLALSGKVIGISGLGSEPIFPRSSVPVATTAPPRPGTQPETQAATASGSTRPLFIALAAVGAVVLIGAWAVSRR